MAKNVHTNGRNRETRHIRLHHRMTGSVAFRHLPGSAVKLLIALMRLDNGELNGELFLSVRKAAEDTVQSPKTIGKAFAALQQHGFIEPTEVGSFSQKVRLATKWRLTWLPMKGRGPTNEWERWRPIEAATCNKLRWEKFPATVGEIPESPQRNAISVGLSPTVQRATRSNQTNHDSGNSPTQVVYHVDRDQQATASSLQCNALREIVRAWLVDRNVTQRYLSQASGISTSKLSRFLDPHGGKLLAKDDFGRLALIVGFQQPAPQKKLAVR